MTDYMSDYVKLENEKESEIIKLSAIQLSEKGILSQVFARRLIQSELDVPQAFGIHLKAFYEVKRISEYRQGDLTSMTEWFEEHRNSFSRIASFYANESIVPREVLQEYLHAFFIQGIYLDLSNRNAMNWMKQLGIEVRFCQENAEYREIRSLVATYSDRLAYAQTKLTEKTIQYQHLRGKWLNQIGLLKCKATELNMVCTLLDNLLNFIEQTPKTSIEELISKVEESENFKKAAQEHTELREDVSYNSVEEIQHYQPTTTINENEYRKYIEDRKQLIKELHPDSEHYRSSLPAIQAIKDKYFNLISSITTKEQQLGGEDTERFYFEKINYLKELEIAGGESPTLDINIDMNSKLESFVELSIQQEKRLRKTDLEIVGIIRDAQGLLVELDDETLLAGIQNTINILSDEIKEKTFKIQELGLIDLDIVAQHFPELQVVLEEAPVFN